MGAVCCIMSQANVENLMISWTNGSTGRVDFTILGEPRVQNGWRVRWRGVPFPRVYDPRAREKTLLRKEVKRALVEGGDDLPPPTFPIHLKLKVRIKFYAASGHNKDLDNMTKFLLDALEGAIYADDKCIVEMHLSKEQSPQARTEVSVEML
jgi:Holliday junction resolvase RusA-like endonuclease